MNDHGESPRRQWTATAVAFVVIGTLITVLSGLCTGYLGVITAMCVKRGGYCWPGRVSAVLEIGGVFITIGIGYIIAGLRERKRN